MPRRAYYGPDKLRAAFLAGAGKSGAEVAEIIGGTTGPRVRAMLRRAGLTTSCAPVTRTIPIVLRNADVKALKQRADEHEAAPESLAAELVRVVVAEPTLLRNLLDESAP